MPQTAPAGPTTPPQQAAGKREAFSSKRLLPLDGLRGIAILLILVHHLFPTDMPTLIGRWCGRFVNSAWFGVDLFFVLSGFLITGILFDARQDRHFFRNFYARRTLRVFPLYYGVLAVTLILLPLIFRLPLHLHDQPWLWLYGVNLYPLIRHDSFWFPSPLHLEYGHFWSLAVEEHFYLVWPLVVFLFSRKPLMWISALAALAALVMRIVFLKVIFPHTLFYPHVLYQTTFLRMDGLVLGGWAALAVRSPGGGPRPGLIWAVLAASGLAIIGIFFHDGGLWRGNTDIETAGYSLLAIFFAALLFPIVTGTGNPLQRFLSMGWLRFFGRYSYGIYVFHFLLVPIFPRLVPAGPHHEIETVLISLAGSIAISVASYHLYEKQFLRLKRYFESRHVHQKPE